MFGNIKSISAFDSAYDLILHVYGCDHGNSAPLAKDINLTDDQMEFLQALNDYEYFKFFLLNDKIVIVADSDGEISGEPMPYRDFCSETIEYVRENA